jgi:Rrf2 family protein
MVNSRFTVALHVLCLLAHQPAQPLTSEFIAGSVNTNPVVIRRILATLRKAGLVKSRPGVAGGWELVGQPSAITLGRVYQLIRPGTVFALHTNKPNPRCPIGKNVQQGLLGHYRKAQAALEHELARATIAGVLHDVLAVGK